ncbi:sensor histidine kinase [Delftia sp. GW456-R20]|uniref:sensor histidine kinase n=1 Tax=Delftia sp. GW456-R20 TaxID=1827145 RepID=UPI000B03E586|nr:ATP-binding protein [Delftia sp. GW456-R20]
MKDPLRTLAICLALGLLQMLGLCAWLWQAGAQAPPWLSLASLALLVSTALLCAMGARRLHRLLLWRRRRSPRPSREVQAERRRIAADLHDGVGGLLVHAMALLDPRETRQRQAQELLEQALLDLRLMVDAMDAMEDALPVRLARLRHRLQPVLDRRGMRICWSVADPHAAAGLRGVPDLPDLPDLPRGQPSQQLLAIAQEAVSNALQHARATTLWLVLEPVDRADAASPGRDARRALHWELRVEDDGCGLPSDPGPAQGAIPPGLQGMGLAGMHRRAHAIGAVLDILPRAGGGTVVRVRW